MQDEKWKEEKLTQLSNDLGRCAREMVKKGSCPKKAQCNHPHLKDVPRGAKKKVCFRELETPGSCPRQPHECHFSHSITDADRKNPDINKQFEQEKLSSKRICVNEYREPKSCHKGEKCGFRQEISEKERTCEVLKEKMNQKWSRITGKATEDVTNETDKATISDVFIQEFRTFMKEIKSLVNNPGRCP